jgi:hypothetical protein
MSKYIERTKHTQLGYLSTRDKVWAILRESNALIWVIPSVFLVCSTLFFSAPTKVHARKVLSTKPSPAVAAKETRPSVETAARHWIPDANATGFPSIAATDTSLGSLQKTMSAQGQISSVSIVKSQHELPIGSWTGREAMPGGEDNAHDMYRWDKPAERQVHTARRSEPPVIDTIKWNEPESDNDDRQSATPEEDTMPEHNDSPTPPEKSAEQYHALFTASAAPVFLAGGSGTAEAPYLLSSAEDLLSLMQDNDIDGNDPVIMAAHFQLTNDIDMLGRRCYPVGSVASPFTGVFDGNGFAVRNLELQSTGKTPLGLFACVAGDTAEIRDLRLSIPVISGYNAYVGGLVGHLESGVLHHCEVDNGRISSTKPVVGGLVGIALQNAVIHDCRVSASVKGTHTVGGLIGRNQADIRNCQARGMVVGEQTVGGFAGQNEASILNCSAQVSLHAENIVGGVVGKNTKNGQIKSCSVRGQIWGSSYLGGLSGQCAGSICDSYCLSSLSGIDHIGGLVGGLGMEEPIDPNKTYDSNKDDDHHQLLLNCYAAGAISGRTCVGGLVGSGWTGEVIQCLWDAEVTGMDRMCGQQTDTLFVDKDSYGASTTAMQIAETFAAIGWFGTSNHEHCVWTVETDSYPKCAWE